MDDVLDKGAAMTAIEIKARCEGIAKLLHPGAHVSMSITASGGKPAWLGIWPTSICADDDRRHFTGTDLESVLLEGEAWASTYKVVRRDAVIRKLALDIIDLTDQHGECTVAMLRGRDHPQGDIDAHKDAACIRAGELAGNAPFEVT